MVGMEHSTANILMRRQLNEEEVINIIHDIVAL